MEPNAWCRESRDEVVAVIRDQAIGAGATVYEKLDGRGLMATYGWEPPESIRMMVMACGLDADYHWDWRRREYVREAVDPLSAYLDWNGDGLSAQLVFMNDKELVASIADDSVWDIHQGFEAREALMGALPDALVHIVNAGHMSA